MRKPRRKRVSLQDIATKAGTTRMTVSRCLRDPETVSEPLRGLIQSVAQELGHLPNPAPSIMAGQNSRTIGVLVPSVTNQVFSDVLAGALDEAWAAGYRVLISHYGYDPLAEERALTGLVSYNVDGLILSDRKHTAQTLRVIDHAEIPVVEIMDSSSPALQQAIGYDNESAAFEMVSRMIALGRRHIVYLAVRLDERTLLRQAGYARAMRAHGLEPVTLESAQKSSFSVGAILADRVLSERPDADGIFCTNDDVAVGAFFQCGKLGRIVPDDIAIAGFHGHDMGQVLSPVLASVLTPRYQIGALALREIMRRVEGCHDFDRRIDLGYKIVTGGTI